MKKTYQEKKRFYVVLLKETAIRDAQACRNCKHDPFEDDAWTDVSLPMYIGIHFGTEKSAKLWGAEYVCTDPENIEVVDVIDRIASENNVG